MQVRTVGVWELICACGQLLARKDCTATSTIVVLVILLFYQAGNFDEPRLEDIISQAEALDMDALRSEIDKHTSDA